MLICSSECGRGPRRECRPRRIRHDSAPRSSKLETRRCAREKRCAQLGQSHLRLASARCSALRNASRCDQTQYSSSPMWTWSGGCLRKSFWTSTVSCRRHAATTACATGLLYPDARDPRVVRAVAEDAHVIVGEGALVLDADVLETPPMLKCCVSASVWRSSMSTTTGAALGTLSAADGTEYTLQVRLSSTSTRLGPWSVFRSSIVRSLGAGCGLRDGVRLVSDWCPTGGHKCAQDGLRRLSDTPARLFLSPSPHPPVQTTIIRPYVRVTGSNTHVLIGSAP